MSRGYFLVFLTAIISGFSVFLNKFGVSVVNSNIYTLLRVSVVALLLTSLLIVFKNWRKLIKPTRRQWFLLITIGFIGGSLPFLLFFKGLSLTTASQGSFIHKTMFIYVAILATLFLKEKVNREFFIGGLLIFLANILLLKTTAPSFGRGDLLVILATLLWAVENTLSKYLLKNIESNIVAWSRMFFGTLFIILFLSFANQLAPVAHLTLRQINWVLITAFILLAYVMTWYSGLKYIPVSQATVILSFGSPITTLLSLIFGGRVSLSEALSSILILAGIIFIFGLKDIWGRIKTIKNLVHVQARS